MLLIPIVQDVVATALPSLGEFGMLGAFIIVVGMFLKFLSGERAARADERADYIASIEKLEADSAQERRDYLNAIAKLGTEFSATVKMLMDARR